MRRVSLLWMLMSLAGCSLGNLPTPPATYLPVPDSVLYAKIAEISGVTRVELRWTNGFDDPNSYGGTIYVGQHADAPVILDRALAILRQGRPGADLGAIEVAPEGAYAVFPSQFGLWTESDFTARYGPQPGSGLPPPTPLRRTR